jgi:peroxiredoxin
MRWIWAALSLTAWAWATPTLAAETEALEVGVKRGQLAPHFALRNAAGDSIALADSLGTGPVLMTFWLTTCNSCKKEMPDLNKLHATYAPKGAKFFAINISEEADKVASKAEEWKMEVTVLLDQDMEVTEAYKIRTTPTVVILDRQGVVRFHGFGSRKRLARILRDLL